jgi:hypothetical protein
VYRIAVIRRRLPLAADAIERPSAVTYVSGGVDAAWIAAQSAIRSWRTMTTRFASSPKAPVVISVDEGYGGQPQKRTTFTSIAPAAVS